jgi:hypothetical protein
MRQGRRTLRRRLLILLLRLPAISCPVPPQPARVHSKKTTLPINANATVALEKLNGVTAAGVRLTQTIVAQRTSCCGRSPSRDHSLEAARPERRGVDPFVLDGRKKLVVRCSDSRAVKMMNSPPDPPNAVAIVNQGLRRLHALPQHGSGQGSGACPISPVKAR